MRQILCTSLYLLLVLALTVLPPAPALSDEPSDEPLDLPTDGIDEPAPGPLALPAHLAGPDGSDLVRSVTLRTAFTALEVLTRYEVPEQRGAVKWRVTVHAFDRKGLAHKELHRELTIPASGPLPPWDERLERVSGAPGIMLRPKATAGSYFGVVRQCYVRVDAWVSRPLPAQDRQALVDRHDSVTRDLAFRVWTMVQEASSALRPVKTEFVEQVTLDHRYDEQAARSRLIVRVTPGSEFGEGQAHFSVFAGSRGRKVHASADRLRERPLAIIEFPKATDPGLETPKEADPTGTTVRVFRVIEGDALAIEEIRLMAGARGTQVSKTP